MYYLDVIYLGKRYQFRDADSITLADRLEREFGRIERYHATEAGTEYWTVKGAQAYIADR